MRNYRLILDVIVSSTFLLCAFGCSPKPVTQTVGTPVNAQQAQLQAIMMASGGNAAATVRSSTVSPDMLPAFSPRPVRPSGEIAPGNTIHLLCIDDPKVTADAQVEFDGTVKLPYDVRMQAAGLTVEQFQQAVRERYRVFFRTAPNITVGIIDHKTFVRAQGLVDKPGQYLVSQDGSIDEVIAAAGGLQKTADSQPVAKYARIVDGSYRAALKLADYYSGNQNSAPKWRGGETVFFQNEGDGIGDLLGVDKRYVQVMGQVRAPGEYPFRENANFFYYLVQAGGPTDRANMADLVVMRTDGPKLEAIPFTMEEPEKIPGIQGGDVVLVQADNPSKLEKDTTIFGNIGGFMSSMAAVLLVAGL